MSSTTNNMALSYSAAQIPPCPTLPLTTAETPGADLQSDTGSDIGPTRDIIQWCLDNQQAILALHSSATYTSIFALDCACCKLFYKHCMFSNRERKSDYPMCRWCSFDEDCPNSRKQFEVQWHIHCNRSGKKACKPPTYPYSLERRVPFEASIKDIPVTAPVYEIKAKMSQKERKAAAKAEREKLGF